ncbi:MAG: ribbon-helix-helix protein, CopG family [Candidatus Jettenia caeni]|nr:MAG: ribbon-helix-helix protein, CopG family [Candidatus Jettenia caeni]
MVQAEIQLTEEQMATLEKLARQRNISVSDLIHEGIDNLLRCTTVTDSDELKKRARAIAGRFKSGLADLSRRHDDYLVETLDS